MAHDTPYTSPDQRKLGARYYLTHVEPREGAPAFNKLPRTDQFAWTKRALIHRSVREWLHNDEGLIKHIDVVGVAKKIFEFYPDHLATDLPHDVVFELIDAHDETSDDAVPVESLHAYDLSLEATS